MTGWLNRLRRYLIISAATSLIMGVVAIPLSNAALQAYLEVETFAPWNMLVSYFQILTLPSNEATAEFPALRPFEPIPQAEHVSKNFSNSYSLTRGAAFYLRPITAVIDLVLHIFSDAGPIGFIFAVLQLAIGAGLMLVWYRDPASGPSDGRGFYFYTIGLPLGTLVFASIAAIPVWLLAYVALAAFFDLQTLQLPISFGLQSGATGGVLLWVRDKVLEPAVHDAVAKSLERTADTVKGNSLS